MIIKKVKALQRIQSGTFNHEYNPENENEHELGKGDNETMYMSARKLKATATLFYLFGVPGKHLTHVQVVLQSLSESPLRDLLASRLRLHFTTQSIQIKCESSGCAS